MAEQPTQTVPTQAVANGSSLNTTLQQSEQTTQTPENTAESEAVLPGVNFMGDVRNPNADLPPVVLGSYDQEAKIQTSETLKSHFKALNLTTNYICNYKVSDEEIVHGTYYNGTISSFYNNEITLWDVNFDTGVISKRFTVDCEFIGTEVILDVCSSGSAEAEKNLEKLTSAYIQLGDHFTVNIDAGIGVGKFIPSRGGEGHITTAEGVNAHYLFGTDGSVVKQKEVDLNAILAEFDDRIDALETV